VGYTSMVLAFLLICFGIRAYRDNVNGGSISFGRAFKVGGLITVVACLIYVATWEVVYFNFMPDFADKYAAAAIAKERASGATAEQVEAKQAEMQKLKKLYANPLFNAGFTFLEPLPVGLIMTLVCAGVMSRRRKEST
ncbi:MAG TPA: DUF4199 domain-containing protein, partial [Longimicrobiales bacterium]|nr:DUF4199 domain-containing protein [Longimicrobiales bacterium]